MRASLLITYSVAQCLDVVTTLYLRDAEKTKESNPLVRKLIEWNPISFVLFKIITTTILSFTYVFCDLGFGGDIGFFLGSGITLAAAFNNLHVIQLLKKEKLLANQPTVM